MPSMRVRKGFDSTSSRFGQTGTRSVTLAKKPERYIDACSSAAPVREWRTSSA